MFQRRSVITIESACIHSTCNTFSILCDAMTTYLAASEGTDTNQVISLKTLPAPFTRTFSVQLMELYYFFEKMQQIVVLHHFLPVVIALVSKEVLTKCGLKINWHEWCFVNTEDPLKSV